MTAQASSSVILAFLFFVSMRACRQANTGLPRFTSTFTLSDRPQVAASRAVQHQHAGEQNVSAQRRVVLSWRLCLLSLFDISMQRSAFASVDTLIAQLEIETGLRVRLRQQRVMLAGKFVMLMYTIRTVYTVLVLLGFSLKRAAPLDPHSECR